MEAQFSSIDTVLNYVKQGEKPIVYVVLGTIWSPTCYYTMSKIQELSKLPEYQENIEFFYVDQDSELQFCFGENIPVGFSTILLFVKGEIVDFQGREQAFDQSNVDSKRRLIRQLSFDQAKAIADEAILILNGKSESIPYIE